MVAQCGFVNGIDLCFWGLSLGLDCFFYKGHSRNGEVHICGLLLSFWDLDSKFTFPPPRNTYFYLISPQNHLTLCKNQNSSERVKSAEKQLARCTLALHASFESFRNELRISSEFFVTRLGDALLMEINRRRKNGGSIRWGLGINKF